MTLLSISEDMTSSSNYNLMINQNNIAKNVDRSTKQIVFIDSQVEDYQFLAAGVVSGIETVILDSHRDGIEQITSALSHRDFTTIHLVSHGSPGCLYLGNSQLSLDTLARYKSDLRTWFNSSSSSLLIYGCNVAAGDAGEEFVAKLHDITNAEIAASTTRTGNAAKGGDWNLEVTTRQLAKARMSLAFKSATLQDYRGILDPVNANFQPLRFNDTAPTRVSGNDKQAGAKYRFRNVITVDGTQVDAIVTIDAISGGAAIVTLDNRTVAQGDPANKEDYFAPEISATNNAGRVDFSITFLDAADDSSVTLENFRLNSIDIDGGAEFVEYGNFNAFTLAQNTDLVVTQQPSGRTRFRGTGAYNGLIFNDVGRVQAEFDAAEVVQLSMGLAKRIDGSTIWFDV